MYGKCCHRHFVAQGEKHTVVHAHAVAEPLQFDGVVGIRTFKQHAALAVANKQAVSEQAVEHSHATVRELKRALIVARYIIIIYTVYERVGLACTFAFVYHFSRRHWLGARAEHAKEQGAKHESLLHTLWQSEEDATTLAHFALGLYRADAEE